MKVTYFQRKPYDFHFSIEKLFDTIREHLSDQIKYSIYTLPFYSIGLFQRFFSSVAASRQQGNINHITGDIYFITPVLKKGITINTYHDFTFLKDSKGIKRFILWYFWVHLPVKYSKYVTVISETTKRELLATTKCSKDKVIVIPNIIPQHLQQHEHIFNSNQPNILHIGTTPNKNIERLIEAIKHIKCRLTIIGKLTKEITTSLEQNKIEYTNKYQISDEALEQEYINCDLLSFCSLNEGFGMPILEAQAIGRPVVTSNLSSMPEVAGEGACLIDPYSVDSIKAGITKVIKNKVYRQQLINHGLENVNRFNPQTVTGMYEALYQKIIDEQHK
ncbi:glycosyltransferase family 4 protein [Carboxylicivirga marina]|uniref:Glycosyltransferase family 4 protein n=1 Tax=Carboxylicivirga marina TaxID=2800988 RepID=A0ABS1HJ14_9BACT|nr:glycosyltransferase family 1 protein [Carboxylicivirga marina]MBK3517668.1 glycosyltransferase family 4 protein [Carboxylicivirga marina]